MQDFPVGVSHALLTWIWRLWRYPCFGRLTMGCFGYNFVKSQYCRWFAQYCHLYLSGNIRILFTSILHPYYLLMMVGIRCACAHCGLFFHECWIKIPIPEGECSIFWPVSGIQFLMEKMHHHRKKTHQIQTQITLGYP